MGHFGMILMVVGHGGIIQIVAITKRLPYSINDIRVNVYGVWLNGTRMCITNSLLCSVGD
jgi:hypothetical protein